MDPINGNQTTQYEQSQENIFGDFENRNYDEYNETKEGECWYDGMHMDMVHVGLKNLSNKYDTRVNRKKIYSKH